MDAKIIKTLWNSWILFQNRVEMNKCAPGTNDFIIPHTRWMEEEMVPRVGTFWVSYVSTRFYFYYKLLLLESSFEVNLAF